jgi:hypothetical protein
MLLIDGIYYNPAFITCIQKETSLTTFLTKEEPSEWFCIYFSVPVIRSKQCTLHLNDGSFSSDSRNKVNFVPHLFPDKDPIDVWMLKVDQMEDVERIASYLQGFEQ